MKRCFIMILATVFTCIWIDDLRIASAANFVTMSDGAKISYEVAGDGFPLILIHGGDETETGLKKGKVSWDFQFEEFAKSFKVVRFDIRGSGESTPLVGEDPFNFNSWTWGEKEHRATTDVIELMNYLNIQKAHICGLSIGSAISAQLAVFYPERVEKLILVSPWLGATFPAGQQQMEKLKQISYKTLFTGGADDTQYIIESNATESVGYHPTRWTIDDAGHFCNSDQPRQFNTNILVFLSPKLFAAKGEMVNINLSVINPASGFKEDIQVEFPDGREATLVKSQTYSKGLNYYTWLGKVKEDKSSNVLLTVLNNNIFGYVHTGGDSYSMHPYGDAHRIVKNDPVLSANYGDDMFIPEIDGISQPNRSSVLRDSGEDGSAVDVLILYTQKMKDEYGEEKLKALIEEFVKFTNKVVFTNSGINTELRLVGIEIYDDPGANEDVGICMSHSICNTDNLPNPPDALVHIRDSPKVAELRNKHKTDLVSLFRVLQPNRQCRGCGSTLTSKCINREGCEAVFSVIEVSSEDISSPSSSAMTFAHEIGHNFGCGHDRDQGGQGPAGQAAYEYSYGYDVSGQFATIMSYDWSGKRIAYFSTPSPSIGYDGMSIGTSNEDNARTINNTKSIVANFRQNDNTYPPEAKVNPPEQTVNGGSTVTLDGADSTDDDGIVSYQWVQTAGPAVTFSDSLLQRPTFIAPNTGGVSLSFQLTVTDKEGLQDTDACIVNIVSLSTTTTITDNSTTTTRPTSTTVTTSTTTTTVPLTTTTTTRPTSTTVTTSTTATTVPLTTTTTTRPTSTTVTTSTTVPLTTTTTIATVVTASTTTTTTPFTTTTTIDNNTGRAGDTNCFISTVAGE